MLFSGQVPRDENRFVLISLVRSNDQLKLGFVGERNRLIVAMSRARCGVYIFGNDQLMQEKSKEWKLVPGVIEDFDEASFVIFVCNSPNASLGPILNLHENGHLLGKVCLCTKGTQCAGGRRLCWRKASTDVPATRGT